MIESTTAAVTNVTLANDTATITVDSIVRARKARQAIFKSADFNRNTTRFNRIYRFYGSSHTYRQNCDRIAIAYLV